MYGCVIVHSGHFLDSMLLVDPTGRGVWLSIVVFSWTVCC